jgi:hypothetical protein
MIKIERWTFFTHLSFIFSFFFWFLVVVENVLLLEDTRQGGECDKPPLDQFVIEKEPN